MQPDTAPSARRLAGFAAPALPLAGLSVPLYVLLPTVYADTLGLGLALTGSLLLAARLWDAVSDPLIGWACDRFSLPFGRRRGWMLAGTPLTSLATILLFNPPDDAGPLWLLGLSLAAYLGWTMLLVPYGAWAAEAGQDYHSRTRIMSWREAAVILGTILASALPALTDDTRQALGWLGWGMGLLLPPAVLLACVSLPEPSRPHGRPPRLNLPLLWQNRPFRLLLAAYGLNGIANGIGATLFLLFVTHRLQAAEQAGPLLAAYFFCGLLSVPLWLAVSRRLGKDRAWRISLFAACTAFATVPLLGPGDLALFTLICLASGLALGADMVLPPAMQADVVEADTLAGGGGRAGLYIALWGMATKLALASAVGLAFPLLAWSGFDPARTPADQTAETTLPLALLYGLAPILCKLAALACFRPYRLDAAALDRLRHPPGDTAPCPSPSGHSPPSDPSQPSVSSSSLSALSRGAAP